MGTNFYIIGAPDDDHDDPEWHLGKRSAAGAYCWDCGLTLCMGGEEWIHYDSHGWYESCPSCGACAKQEGLEEGAAGRELGFNTSSPERKAGVASCSSFSWATDPNYYKETIKQMITLHARLENIKNREIGKVIEDEYGRQFTIEEFEEILKECPVQYTKNIGKWFC